MNNYELETLEYLNFGLKIFQVFRFDDDDEKHCRQYWNYCGRPDNGIWVDMGSGIGTVGYYLNKFAPNLIVYSVTDSQYQHEYQTDFFTKQDNLNLISKKESFLNTSFDDSTVDYISFNESFGYANCEDTLRESARILKSGGKLFIKEILKYTDFKDDKSPGGWGYNVWSGKTIISSAEKNNLIFKTIRPLSGSVLKYLEFMRSSKKMQEWHPDLKFWEFSSDRKSWCAGQGISVTEDFEINQNDIEHIRNGIPRRSLLDLQKRLSHVLYYFEKR